MSKVRIKQIRSVIDQTKRQKATMRALGLRKINHSVEHVLTPQVEGMIRKVEHLVTVETVA
ncbi:MAG: 50S ribosomal protein L30 [Saprospiraceae bacterium]|nr:50S ribosomal protein L30 [Saprospiraceae bacterium]